MLQQKDSTREYRVCLIALFGLVLSACGSIDDRGIPMGSATVGPQGMEDGRFGRQRWLIPLPNQNLLMTAVLWRPKGLGPFPLAVISHASSQNPSDRTEDPTSKYEEVAQWFVRRGYAVLLPIRPGHSTTGGPYLEDQGGCDDADYAQSGRAGAAITAAAIEFMMTQGFLQKNHTIVVGQSAGGWSALALSSHNPPSARAIINFAGGRGGRSAGQPNTNCAPDRLIQSAEDLGRNARVPTLWIYTENDTYFGPNLTKQMVAAFRRGGGLAEYNLLPPVGDDGHFLMLTSNAIPLWAPIVEKFLARHR